MASNPTYLEMLQPGELGDGEIAVTLTARQWAALTLLVTLATQHGIDTVAFLQAHRNGGPDTGKRLSVELPRALARLGIAVGRALGGDEDVAACSALLAALDGEAAEL